MPENEKNNVCVDMFVTVHSIFYIYIQYIFFRVESDREMKITGETCKM